MDLGLRGKLAVVTGSTAGIGYAIATALSDEGARVAINGRTQARVDKALLTLGQRNRGAEYIGVAADLGTASGIGKLLKEVPNTDILVNNLGIFEVKPFLEIGDADWLRFFEVNVMSGVRLSRAYLPGMLKKNWGRIIFISSESAQHIALRFACDEELPALARKVLNDKVTDSKTIKQSVKHWRADYLRA